MIYMRLTIHFQVYQDANYMTERIALLRFFL